MLPKIALINLFIQIWSSIYIIVSFLETSMFLVGIYSIAFGIFKMLKQKKLKKLYIYSSISNMGLLLCILIDNSLESIVAIYYFLLTYLIMSSVLWTIFILTTSNQTQHNKINYPLYLNFFNQLFTQNYIFAISICFVFFSLAAIPPFIGFLSKIYLYLILIKSYQYELAIFLLYLGTFGAYYYIKFLKIILFENTNKKNPQNFYPLIYFNLESTLYSFSLFFLLFSALESNFFFFFFFFFFFI